MRRAGEGGVSVNWMEYFLGDIEAQIAQIQKQSSLSYSKNGYLIRLNIGQTLNFFADHFDLNFVYKPTKLDKSHSEILDLPQFGSDEMYLAEVLMTEYIEASADVFLTI